MAGLWISLAPAAEDTAAAAQARPVLIIDAGHGGEDGGAVAADGTVEADINLGIACKLNLLAQLCGTDTEMTRADEHIHYPADASTIAARKTADQKQRAALINSVANGVLISIHQNEYPAPSPHGAQVLYASSMQSKAFGEAMHAALVNLLDPENRRVAAPISNDIYLMRSVQCPAVLVECGFLSNPEELKKLKDESYQLKLSMVMLGSFLEYFQTGWNQ